MDNYRIDITAEGENVLRKAIDLAMTRRDGDLPCKTLYWAIRAADDPAKPDPHRRLRNDEPRRERIVFFWHEQADDKDRHPFPVLPSTAAIADIVIAWLKTVKRHPQPDHDGSNGHGWRLYNEDWARVDDDSSALFAVHFEWAWYGK